MSKARTHLKGDERILGESDFVKEVLSEQKEQFERRYKLEAQGYDTDRVFEKVSEVFDIEPEEICKWGNQPLQVRARSLVCYWAVKELGMSGTSVGKLLGIGQLAMNRAGVRVLRFSTGNILGYKIPVMATPPISHVRCSVPSAPL
jgi:hypothetical protein